MTRCVNHDDTTMSCTELHGFRGEQDLSASMISHVLGRISLNAPPGFLCDHFTSTKKIYDKPLPYMRHLQVTIRDSRGQIVEFRGMKHSFDIEIMSS